MIKKFLIYGLVFVAGYAYLYNGNNKPNLTENTSNTNVDLEVKSVEQLPATITKEEPEDLNPLAEENKKIFDSKPLDRRSPEFIAPSTKKEVVTPQKPMGSLEKKFFDVLSKFATTENGTKIIDKIFSPIVLNNEFNKDPYLSLSEELIREGSGNVARCGDFAIVEYLLKDERGTTLKNTKLSSPEEIHIGFPKTNEGIDYSLIGMKEHAIKRKLLPRSQMKKINGQSNFFALEIELVKINNSPLPKIFDQVNLFDQTKVTSTSKPFKCGDNINIKYTIKNIKGDILDSSANFISFKIGQNTIPYILNLMTQGMYPASKRTAIIPYQALIYPSGPSFYANKLNLLVKDELAILEIESAAQGS